MTIYYRFTGVWQLILSLCCNALCYCAEWLCHAIWNLEWDYCNKFMFLSLNGSVMKSATVVVIATAVATYFCTKRGCSASKYFRAPYVVSGWPILQKTFKFSRNRNLLTITCKHWVISLFGPVFCWDFHWVLNSDWDRRSVRVKSFFLFGLAERFAETKLRTERSQNLKLINSPVDFVCTRLVLISENHFPF